MAFVLLSVYLAWLAVIIFLLVSNDGLLNFLLVELNLILELYLAVFRILLLWAFSIIHLF